MGEDQVEDYQRDLASIKSAEKESQIWSASPDAAKVFLGTEQHIVGDIVVGGHGIVPEGLKLEKSAIRGGGQETYVDTVASSDGKMLAKEDMEKLGLGDPKSVENLRKRLEEIAQGQDWTLQVIDTPRGREYRGIIGNEGDEDGEKKEGEEKTQEAEAEEGGEGSQEEYFKEGL